MNIIFNIQVYWLGPILGGIGASLIYKHAFTLPVTEANTEYSPVQVQDKEVLVN